MNHNINYLPMEDQELRCSGCLDIVTMEEYRESEARRYEEPRCTHCMHRDEIKTEQAIDRLIFA